MSIVIDITTVSAHVAYKVCILEEEFQATRAHNKLEREKLKDDQDANIIYTKCVSEWEYGALEEENRIAGIKQRAQDKLIEQDRLLGREKE